MNTSKEVRNLSKLGLMIVMMSFGLPAVAGGNEDAHGKTMCYLFKNSKPVSKSICTYQGSESSSVGAGSTQDFDFTIPKFGKINKSWSSVPKRNENDEIIYDKNGIILSNDYAEINHKKGTFLFRDLNSFKIISRAEVENSDSSRKYAYCVRANDKSIELCTLY